MPDAFDPFSGGDDDDVIDASDDTLDPPPDQANPHEAVDRLSEQDRVNVEARMLPTSRPLRPDEIEATRAKLADYLAEQKVKASRCAREIDYSAAVVSEFLAGKYKGDVEKITHAVNNWMERDGRRRQIKLPDGYVSTWVAQTIRSIALTADKRSMMAAIVAPAGSGKTKVLKVLAEELRGLYLYCDADMTARDFLYTLAVMLDWNNKRATKAVMKRHIVEKLGGTNRIILLDEAQQLGKAINSLRSIHDQTGCPIVMAGTADILAHVNDRSDGRGQFSSRCIQYNLLDEVRNAERPSGPGIARGASGGRDLFSEQEIREFFASKKIRFATDALKLVWRLACLPNHGTIRLAEKIAEVALDLSGDADVISRDDVIAALTILHNANARYLLKLVDQPAAVEAKPARIA